MSGAPSVAAWPVETFGADEEPGSMRASQQWQQRNEYCLMQNKFANKHVLEEVTRMRRAVTAAEKRQDLLAAFPEDFLRHWEESERDDRKLMVARVAQHHMSSGVCCLPSCLVWLWSLRVARRSVSRWAAQQKADEEAEQAATEAAACAAAQEAASSWYY